MTVRRKEGAGPNRPDEPRTATFVLTIRLGANESPSGSIRPANQATAETFNGWMALMSVLNRLRDQAGGAPDEEVAQETPPRRGRRPSRSKSRWFP
jgi:hypothetical protein